MGFQKKTTNLHRQQYIPTYTDSNTSQNCDKYKTYLYNDNSNIKEDIVLATNSALKNIVNGVQEHVGAC